MAREYHIRCVDCEDVMEDSRGCPVQFKRAEEEMGRLIAAAPALHAAFVQLQTLGATLGAVCIDVDVEYWSQNITHWILEHGAHQLVVEHDNG